MAARKPVEAEPEVIAAAVVEESVAEAPVAEPAVIEADGAGAEPAAVEAVDGGGNPVAVEVGEDGIPVLPLAEVEEVTVVMRVWISGTRNGEPWPQPGGEIALPADEAARYVDLGYASLPE